MRLMFSCGFALCCTNVLVTVNLCLNACPGVTVALIFIVNLLKRHPNCKVLLHRKNDEGLKVTSLLRQDNFTSLPLLSPPIFVGHRCLPDKRSFYDGRERS